MIGSLLTAAGLLAGTVLAWRMHRLGPPAERPRTVSVVVPARDEEHTLPELLRSLDAAAGAGVTSAGTNVAEVTFEVIVVDDGSTDATAEVARTRGATVLSAGAPPPGWLGKPWACHRGAGAATGEVLVFLDADVEVGPGALDRLVGELDARGGLVSVQPFHRTVRPYEELSAYFNAVAVMGVGAAVPSFAGRAVTPTGAFGPCLATSVEDYRRVGGHAAVAGRLLDDVHLGRAYLAHGLPVTCRVGGDDVRFRMYPAGFAQLVEGWSKNVALGAVGTKPWAAIGAAAWVATSAAVAFATMTGLGRWVGGGSVPWSALVGWAVVAAHLWWVVRRLGTFRWWTAAAFVVPLAAFMAIFARSALLTVVRRRVRWRGRTVVLGGHVWGSDSDPGTCADPDTVEPTQ